MAAWAGEAIIFAYFYIFDGAIRNAAGAEFFTAKGAEGEMGFADSL